MSMNFTIFSSICDDFEQWKKEVEELNECTLTDEQACDWWAKNVREDWYYTQQELDEIDTSAVNAVVSLLMACADYGQAITEEA